MPAVLAWADAVGADAGVRDRLAVSIGLIPSDAEATIAVPAGFDLLDGPGDGGTVTVETLHANLVVTDADYVADYERAWSALHRMAVHDDTAEHLLRTLRTAVAG